ncbi:MAG: hypothetical protein ABIJ56_07240 [Pseudomonadota bacterium]
MACLPALSHACPPRHACILQCSSFLFFPDEKAEKGNGAAPSFLTASIAVARCLLNQHVMLERRYKMTGSTSLVILLKTLFLP